MAKNFKKTAIKTEKNEKKFKKSDSFVIAMTWLVWDSQATIAMSRTLRVLVGMLGM